MNCPKHNCKMTLLFTSWVCDVCDPPKGVKVAPVLEGKEFGKCMNCKGKEEIHMAVFNKGVDKSHIDTIQFNCNCGFSWFDLAIKGNWFHTPGRKGLKTRFVGKEGEIWVTSKED